MLEEPKILNMEAKLLVGQQATMSLTDNNTFNLWSGFAPFIKRIQDRKNTDRISLQTYPESYFKAFSPESKFTKWATVEVTTFKNKLPNLDTLEVPAGLYAVFTYTGPSTDSHSAFEYIFGEWLPESIYSIDNRPHFEVLPYNYQPNSLEVHEEIWIPVKEN